MKNYILLTLILVLNSQLNAQVGVNTSTPRSDLDIQGPLTIRGHIRTAGTDQVKGSTGRNTNLLVSNGNGNAPEWKSLRIPVIKPNRFYLLFADSYSDRSGVRPTTVTGKTAYTYDMTLPSNWSTITGLTKDFTVTNSSSKVFFLYEAVVHSNSATQYQGIDFACGIFVDNRLKGVRVADLHNPTSTQYPFNTFTLVATTQTPLSVGTHQVKVACTRRENYAANSNTSAAAIGIGTNASNNTTNVNNFMAQSSLRVEVFEVPEKFLNIVNE